MTALWTPSNGRNSGRGDGYGNDHGNGDGGHSNRGGPDGDDGLGSFVDHHHSGNGYGDGYSNGFNCEGYPEQVDMTALAVCRTLVHEGTLAVTDLIALAVAT